MLLHAIVLSGDVPEMVFYDQATGAPKPGYTIRLNVIDVGTDEKYTVQLNDGFAELEEMKQLKSQGAPPDAIREVAERLKAALPPKLTPLSLEVLRIKGKNASFLTLVCRFAQAASQAAA